MSEHLQAEIERLRARVAELERAATERMQAEYALGRERETSRRQIETELRTRAGQQAAVAELGQLALMGADVPSIMDHASRLLVQTLGVEFCQIRELSADGSALVLKAGVGWKPGMIGHSLPSSPLDSQAGYTLVSGSPSPTGSSVIMAGRSRRSRHPGRSPGSSSACRCPRSNRPREAGA